MTDDIALLKNIHKSFGGRKVLQGVDLCIRRGEIHGFLGPNGAGKSTTLQILCGLIAADDSDPRPIIELFGDSLLSKQQPKIAFVAENLPLYRELTVLEYLSFLGRLRGLKSHRLTSDSQLAIDKLALEAVAKRRIGNLSKGMQQRVAISQVLIGSPEFIVLDEPTVGLDPNSLIEIRQLIKDLAKHSTILFSSHQLSEVEQIATHITMLNRGQVVMSGPMEEILNKQLLSHCTLWEVVIPLGQYQDIENLTKDIPDFKIVSRVDRNSQEVVVKISHANSPLRLLSGKGLMLSECKKVDAKLEELFLKHYHCSGDI